MEHSSTVWVDESPGELELVCIGLDYTTQIFDCVHGYISLTQVEKDVVDTLAFQRLHNIKQLGTAYLVYPTAQHTRFSHSLGVLHVVSEFINALKRESPEADQFSSKEKIQEIRLAALLHDVGHHPFSHVIEEEIIKIDGSSAKHTRLARHIIENTAIRDKIQDYDIRSIESMIRGKNREVVYNSLISSDLDADRLDYIVRDSYFTGVAYGAIDIPRIMKIVRLVDNDITYDEKGLPSIENYLMALMSMYWAVYYHKTITGFSLLLGRIYRELRTQNILPSYNEILECDEIELYGYNDAYLINLIRQGSRENTRFGLMCRRFVNRERLKIVDKDRVYKKYKKGVRQETRLTDLWLKDKLEKIAKEAEINIEDIFLINRSREFVDITGDLINMYDSSTGLVTPINEIENSAISDFVSKSIIEDRVYTIPVHYDDLKEVITHHFGMNASVEKAKIE